MGLGLAILVLAVLASLERPAATNLPDRTGKRVILKSGVVVQPNPAGGHEKVANAATGGSKSEYDRAIADWTEAIRTGPGAPRWWHVSPGPHRQTPPQVIMYERRRHAIDRRGANPTRRASSRHCETASPTSPQICRACFEETPKYSATSSASPKSAVASTSVMASASTRGCTSTGTGFRSYAGAARSFAGVEQETVISQVVIDVLRRQHVENKPSPKLLCVNIRFRPVSVDRIHDFKVTSSFMVDRVQDAHGGQEGNPRSAAAIETSDQQHVPSRNSFEPPFRHANSGLTSQGKRHCLPLLHVNVVVLMRELCDCEGTVAIMNTRFRVRSTRETTPAQGAAADRRRSLSLR